MTNSIDKKLDVDGAIDIPIQLDEVQRPQFLFYLANKVPLTKTELAAECVSDAAGVRSQLQARFPNEVNIGMADTITLSGKARKAVISGGKPYIESGQRLLKKGKSCEGEEKFQAAADFYRQAVTLFQVVKTRFQAVDHESSELNKIIETSKQRHDEAAKEAAKDTVNYHTLLAIQYESAGDECRDSDKTTAVNKYEDAEEELQTAYTSVEEYNESRLLSESSMLSLDPIEERIESISQKAKKIDVDNPKGDPKHNTPDENSNSTVSAIEVIDDNIRNDTKSQTEALEDTNEKISETTSSERSESPEHGDQKAEGGREEKLEILQSIQDDLGRVPRAHELPEDCKYSWHDFYAEFGSWDEALDAAGIDKEQVMLDEIKRVAEKLGRIPTIDDMSEHGAYSSYSSYFGSWSTALGKSGVEENFPEGVREGKLEILQSLQDHLGRAPKANELPEDCVYSQRDFYTEFGSWDEALEAAGIDKEQAILDEIERVAKKLGRIPTTGDMSEHGAYSSYSSYFGSWSTALGKSGVEGTFPEKPEVSREEKVEILQSLQDHLGRAPKANELPEDCMYSQRDFYTEFGSWDQALESAGIDKEQAMLDEIERVAEKLGRIPTTGDMSEHGAYSSYSSYFGSWSTALGKSGVEETFPEKSEVSREEKLEILQSLQDHLGRAPKTNELPEDCKYSRNGFYTEFGSWDEALEAAGIDKEQAMLDDIERVAEKLGRIPTTGDMSEHGAYSSYSSYFGSWDDALEAAGIDKEQSLVDNLRRIAGEVNGKPRTPDANRIGDYSSDIYIAYFGSWDAALEAADIPSTAASDSQAGSPEQSGRSDSPTTLSDEINTNKSKSKGNDRLIQTTNIEDILHRIDGVGPSSLHAVNKAGYNTLGELCDAQPNDISKYKGIGRTKAQKLIRFALDNVSSEQSPAESFSDTRSQANSGRVQSGGSEAGTDQQGSTALLPSEVGEKAVMDVWETISHNTRHTGQFVLKVIDTETSKGIVSNSTITFVDCENNEIPLEVWKTHELDIDWKQGEWYAISNVNGSAWEVDAEEFEKRLNSTERTEVIQLGHELEPVEMKTLCAGTKEASPDSNMSGTGSSTTRGVKADGPASSRDTNQSAHSESGDIFSESKFEAAEVHADTVTTEETESGVNGGSQQSDTHSGSTESQSNNQTQDSEQVEDDSEEDGILGDIVSDFGGIDGE